MVAYEMDAITNVTSLLGVYEGTNTASGGLLAALTLLSIFFIILIALLRNNPVPESFTAASTVATILALVFMYLEIVTILWVLGFAVLWAASAIALYKSNSV